MQSPVVVTRVEDRPIQVALVADWRISHNTAWSTFRLPETAARLLAEGILRELEAPKPSPLDH